MNNTEKLNQLVGLYFKDKATQSQTSELVNLVNDANDTDISLVLAGVWENFTGNDNVFSQKESERQLHVIFGKGQQQQTISMLNRKRWWWYAAAAIAIIIAGVFITFRFSKDKVIAKSSASPAADVAPGSNKAILTLADGSTIVLDSAANGTLIQQGNVKIIKVGEGVTYHTVGNSSDTAYNTVSVPRGGQYQVILADGSKVWLNAASSLRFPTTFFGKDRKVKLQGEAYFEVAKNAAMPFKINVDGKSEVEVLGTHFNINAYSDEETIATTLLEGKVKVASIFNNEVQTQNAKTLEPGQQLLLDKTGTIKLNKNIDVDEIMAWKDGFFHFENADIKTIMRQFSRWYDVEVVYEGNIKNQTFFAIINRNSPLSQVLKTLPVSDIKFRIEGKKLIVQKV